MSYCALFNHKFYLKLFEQKKIEKFLKEIVFHEGYRSPLIAFEVKFSEALILDFSPPSCIRERVTLRLFFGARIHIGLNFLFITLTKPPYCVQIEPLHCQQKPSQFTGSYSSLTFLKWQQKPQLGVVVEKEQAQYLIHSCTICGSYHYCFLCSTCQRAQGQQPIMRWVILHSPR